MADSQSTTKTCTDCGVTKPVEAFDKWRRRCRVCQAESRRQYARDNPDHVRELLRKKRAKHADKNNAERLARYYANRDRELKRKREYAEQNRERIREGQRQYRHTPEYREYRENRKLYQRAHNRVVYAVKTGRLHRPDVCSRCFHGGDIHAHHEDYSKPLDVMWLCRGCHVSLHGQKAIERFQSRQQARALLDAEGR